MAITYVSGDIFDAAAEVLVVPVNCVGVAGCGLALQFRERYPAWYRLYRECCRTGALQLGRPVLHWGVEPMVLSFPTKDHWHFRAWDNQYSLSEAGNGRGWSFLGSGAPPDGSVSVCAAVEQHYGVRVAVGD